MDIAPGRTYTVPYPFIAQNAVDEIGEVYWIWRPGTDFVPNGPEETTRIAHGVGVMLLEIVDVLRPGRYPRRVFYTRKFIDPDGMPFTARSEEKRLHCNAVAAFRRKARGYVYPYEIVDKESSRNGQRPPGAHLPAMALRAARRGVGKP